MLGDISYTHVRGICTNDRGYQLYLCEGGHVPMIGGNQLYLCEGGHVLMIGGHKLYLYERGHVP